MYFYTYRIDFVDGYYYYGSRKSKVKPEEDKYWGSPKTHKEKWNTTMYWKAILSVFDNVKSMRENENILIRENYKTDPLCLNRNVGGIIFFDEEVRSKISASSKGRSHSEQEKKRRSKNHSGQGNPFYGCNHNPETIEIIRKHSAGENNPRYGITMSSELKNKISLSRGGRKFKVKCPDGTIHEFINQSEFCRCQGILPNDAKKFNSWLNGKRKSFFGWELLDV